MNRDIHVPETFQELRKEYSDKPLHESDLEKEPFKQFEKWFAEACSAHIYEPNAMVLSTVNTENVPSSRVVLFKGVVDGGFSFYTRYTSKKGSEIATNKNVALLFYWPEIHRQVRIQGSAHRLSAAQSDTYFSSRPRDAQLGAIASNQSELLTDRASFEKLLTELAQEYEGDSVPRPDDWGGYAVVPNLFEFWQGRRSRLHDRLVYQLSGSTWLLQRLYP